MGFNELLEYTCLKIDRDELFCPEYRSRKHLLDSFKKLVSDGLNDDGGFPFLFQVPVIPILPVYNPVMLNHMMLDLAGKAKISRECSYEMVNSDRFSGEGFVPFYYYKHEGLLGDVSVREGDALVEKDVLVCLPSIVISEIIGVTRHQMFLNPKGRDLVGRLGIEEDLKHYNSNSSEEHSFSLEVNFFPHHYFYELLKGNNRPLQAVCYHQLTRALQNDDGISVDDFLQRGAELIASYDSDDEKKLEKESPP
jgi:hypothetical protein